MVKKANNNWSINTYSSVRKMEKDIKFYFFESFKIINSNRLLLFVHGIAITNLATKNSVLPQVFLLLLSILSFLIMPVIYGRFTEIIKEEKPETLLKVFRKHLSNYFIYLFCLMAPTFLFLLIFLRIVPEELVPATFSVIRSITTSLMLYVFPLVFLQGKQLIKFTTIVMGVKCLFAHFRYSLPLILLNIGSYFIYQIVFEIFESDLLVENANTLLLLFSRFLPSLLGAFISITLFIAAGMILIKEPLYKNYIDSQST